MKKRNKETEEFIKSADVELARRDKVRAYWDDLKRASVKALRANKQRALKLGERQHGFGGQVSSQHDTVRDAAMLGYSDFDGWAEKVGADTRQSYKEPDTFSDTDTYWNEVTPSATPTADLEVSRDLFQALGKVLTKHQLEIYHLHIERGLGLSDVASVLATSRANISQIWTVIEQKLRAHFEALRGGNTDASTGA